MKRVAISACLMGRECRYDATDNLNIELLEALRGSKLIPFCPEDHAFGSPRPTMDLIDSDGKISAISNETDEDLSKEIIAYAKEFFEKHRDIDLYIGKDRSPSCGVDTAKVYDNNKHLLRSDGTGLMSMEAKREKIECIDAEKFIEER
ncbi:COG1683: Uncharacterized conserved protein / FIG143828: Hypothetical protein YbgA [hydrothermal vent metagenome]|uniref:Uncharacterized protein n=1 Tax=hydrothermal vent metagenome TaxID=652676 RepID=A0A1W1BGA6_9ZZZZ